MKERKKNFEPIAFESSKSFLFSSKDKTSYELQEPYHPKGGNKGFGLTTGVRVHFVGIGGIGMCGLAELLYHSGIFVTGSDLVENTQIQRLRQLGISVFVGHRKENIKSAEIIIQSSAGTRK